MNQHSSPAPPRPELTDPRVTTDPAGGELTNAWVNSRQWSYLKKLKHIYI